jgi:hypothetical protein
MSVALYFDVHVPRAIRDQLRRKGVDVLTAQEDHSAKLTDEEILARATKLDRVVFTHDHRFRALAEDWQRNGKEFAGLLFGHQSSTLIGTYVQDLELIGKATEPNDWKNVVDWLPIK